MQLAVQSTAAFAASEGKVDKMCKPVDGCWQGTEEVRKWQVRVLSRCVWISGSVPLCALTRALWPKKRTMTIVNEGMLSSPLFEKRPMLCRSKIL